MTEGIKLISVNTCDWDESADVFISLPKWLAKAMILRVKSDKVNGEDYALNFLGAFIVGASKPRRVIFRDPATIVYWNDGTKTVVKCDPRDTYSKEAGLALCYMKKALGGSRAFNDILKEWVDNESDA